MSAGPGLRRPVLEMTVLLGEDGHLYGGVDVQLGSTSSQAIASSLIPEHPEPVNLPLDF